MGYLNHCGFEENTVNECVPIGSLSVSSTYQRTGSYSGLIPAHIATAFTHGAQLNFPETAEFYFQYALCRASAGSPTDDKKIFHIKGPSGAVLVSFYLRTAWVWDVYLGDKATLLGTTSIPIPVGTFLLVEGHYKIHDTAGIFELKMPGASPIIFSGDTKPGSDTTAISFAHGNIVGFSSQNLHIDDMVALDTTGSRLNSWPNGLNCWKLPAPLANGFHTAWVASAGQLYECIDESPPSMADYIQPSAPGDKVSFPFGDPDASVKGIAAVVTRAWGQGGGNVKRLCRYDGVDYLSDAFALPGSFAKVDDVMTEKPGGGDWSASLLTGASKCQFGMEDQA